MHILNGYTVVNLVLDNCFIICKKTRAHFKLALRYCKQQETQLRADAYANSLINKDPATFWQSIKKDSSSKLTEYADTIDGVTGEQNISEMWKGHFQKLYNSVPCDNDAVNFKNI